MLNGSRTDALLGENAAKDNGFTDNSGQAVPATRRFGNESKTALSGVAAATGTLALLAALACQFLSNMEAHAAVEPSRRPAWTRQERPHRAFALSSPNLRVVDYTIRRHDAGGRKDVLSANGPNQVSRLMLEIYRPGRENTGFGEVAAEIAARTDELGGPYELTQAGALDTKFGHVAVFAFTPDDEGHARHCLGFARAFDDPLLMIAGWYCKADAEPIDRHALACVLEGLSLLTSANDPKVQELFAAAEENRKFCDARTVDTAP
jgi:hypothetical protein